MFWLSGSHTVPEIVDRDALEQCKEEIEDREGGDTGYRCIDDDLQNALGTYPDEK
jgi:hypothetical protein